MKSEDFRLPVGALADLEKAMAKLRHDASAKGIAPEDTNLTNSLNDIPLYKPEP
jgi:hypothetical protein